MDMGEISADMLMSAVEKAKKDLMERKRLEFELWEQGIKFYISNILRIKI